MKIFARRRFVVGVVNGHLSQEFASATIVPTILAAALSFTALGLGCSGRIAGPGETGGGTGNPGTGGAGTVVTPPAGLTVGATVIHRLTRTEYLNTVRDLFGIAPAGTTGVALSGVLPPDGAGDGFDKDSTSQTAGMNTLQAYEQASSNVVDAVFADAKLKGQLVTCDLTTGTACIKSTLQAFLPRAWRRPVDASEVDGLMALADSEAKAGGSAEEQLKLALRAALTSAKFAYRIEKDSNPADTKPHTINDYELASRISYFLWSSMPDDALFSLASQGKLQDDATLTQQVKRMLADPKATALTDVFAAQWMELDVVPGKVPNPTTFPMVTDAVKQSMVQQSKTFFQDLLTSGGPISNLANSDYTFVDASLAAIYGLPAPKTAGFSKVSLAGTNRLGGVLGQSSFLMHFASQDRPSAVKRGAWVLANLLCAPTPPPPPDVAMATAANELDPAYQARVAMQTAREHLAEHRAEVRCAACHNQIDPVGLGLENYDAVGQYRTTDVGKPIDPSGQLLADDPTTKFTDAQSMAAILAKDSRVASCIAQKQLTFALTHTANSTEVAYIASKTKGTSDSLVNVITNVVLGVPLRTRVSSGGMFDASSVAAGSLGGFSGGTGGAGGSSGTGGAGGGSGTGSMCGVVTMTVSGDPGHVPRDLTPIATLINGPTASTEAFYLAATGGGGATHTCQFTAAQVTTLRNGGTVTVTSSTTEGGNHQVTVSCTKK